jgi:preprotein translocase subunit SecD
VTTDPDPAARTDGSGGGTGLRVAGVLAVAAAGVILVGVIVTALQLSGTGVVVPSTAGPEPIAGGLRLEYRAADASSGVAPADLEAVAEVMRTRVDQTGIAEQTVMVVDGDRIVVDLSVPPEDQSVVKTLRALLGTTGRVDFVPLGPEMLGAGDAVDLAEHPPLFSGDQVSGAGIGIDQSGMRTVDITLRPAGAGIFAAYTASHIGEAFAIVMDGTVLAAPTIQSAIPAGQLQVSGAGEGGFPLEEAQRLVTILGSGALPVPVQEVASNLP